MGCGEEPVSCVAIVGVQQPGGEDVRQEEREASVDKEERVDVGCGREVVCYFEEQLVREAAGWVSKAYTNRGGRRVCTASGIGRDRLDGPGWTEGPGGVGRVPRRVWTEDSPFLEMVEVVGGCGGNGAERVEEKKEEEVVLLPRTTNQ